MLCTNTYANNHWFGFSSAYQSSDTLYQHFSVQPLIWVSLCLPVHRCFAPTLSRTTIDLGFLQLTSPAILCTNTLAYNHWFGFPYAYLFINALRQHFRIQPLIRFFQFTSPAILCTNTLAYNHWFGFPYAYQFIDALCQHFCIQPLIRFFQFTSPAILCTNTSAYNHWFGFPYAYQFINALHQHFGIQPLIRFFQLTSPWMLCINTWAYNHWFGFSLAYQSINALHQHFSYNHWFRVFFSLLVHRCFEPKLYCTTIDSGFLWLTSPSMLCTNTLAYNHWLGFSSAGVKILLSSLNLVSWIPNGFRLWPIWSLSSSQL